MRKAFTLIELLAVIVILAVVALIATPIIMNAVIQSQKSSAKASAYGYIKAIEYSIASKRINSLAYTMPTSFVISDDANLEYKGTRPTAVSLELTEGSVTGGFITINDYTMTIGTNGQVIAVTP